jgi:predicted nuclease of predicted toxin-antitoxin system
VKLLMDENLSRRLVQRIEDLFPGSAHVGSEGLLRAPDRTLWEYAKSNEFSIVTADADFYELATTLGPPPKVIWLRGCDYPTVVAEGLIRNQAIRIAEFLEDPERAVLILRPQ